MLSVLAPPDAVFKSCPAAKVVFVVYDVVLTDQVTLAIVALSKKRD